MGEQNTPNPDPNNDSGVSESTIQNCRNCFSQITWKNLTVTPLHDGNGNYYFGLECPYCGYIICRRQSPRSEPEDIESIAKRDQNPPEDFDDLDPCSL